MEPYTEEDKLNCLVDQNGAVRTLMEKFDLAIDFTKQNSNEFIKHNEKQKDYNQANKIKGA